MKNFLKCGICGWCLEILWTGFHSFRRREMTLSGTSSLWRFPIYGAAGLIRPLYGLLKKKSIFFRGVIYMLLIFAAEFFSGTWLRRHHCCPWNYEKARFNIQGVIRLDYAPLWFFSGLLFEALTCHSSKKAVTVFTKFT